MRRTLIIELDDSTSVSLRNRFDRNLKQIFRNIQDQLKWGDTDRPVHDNDGNAIGRWRLEVAE